MNKVEESFVKKILDNIDRMKWFGWVRMQPRSVVYYTKPGESIIRYAITTIDPKTLLQITISLNYVIEGYSLVAFDERKYDHWYELHVTDIAVRYGKKHVVNRMCKKFPDVGHELLKALYEKVEPLADFFDKKNVCNNSSILEQLTVEL